MNVLLSSLGPAQGISHWVCLSSLGQGLALGLPRMALSGGLDCLLGSGRWEYRHVVHDGLPTTTPSRSAPLAVGKTAFGVLPHPETFVADTRLCLPFITLNDQS